MDNPLVSIIVPCYNQAQFLGEALLSVMNQTYTHWECIIVNDGSPDDTEAIAQKWIEKDSRFKYIYKENGGLSSARNAGLEIVKGDYIQFLDADDCLSVEKISKSLSLIQDYSYYNIIVSNFKFFIRKQTDELGYSSNLASDLFSFNQILYGWDFKFNIPIHCGFFSTSLFDKFQFSEDLGAKEDWIMWLCFFREDISFYFLNETLAFYRQHSGGMTRDKEHMALNTIKALKYLDKIIDKKEYNRFLLYLIGNKIRENEELSTKYEELNNKLLSSNNSFKFKIVKKAKSFLIKIYGYLKARFKFIK